MQGVKRALPNAMSAGKKNNAGGEKTSVLKQLPQL